MYINFSHPFINDTYIYNIIKHKLISKCFHPSTTPNVNNRNSLFSYAQILRQFLFFIDDVQYTILIEINL